MALKETIKQLRDLLHNITTDLQKSENGNKAASQRVRTGTVRLEKVAKLYRKESIKTEKQTKGQKKTSKKVAGKQKTKAAVKKSAKPASRTMAYKRPSAKLPSFR